MKRFLIVLLVLLLAMPMFGFSAHVSSSFHASSFHASPSIHTSPIIRPSTSSGGFKASRSSSIFSPKVSSSGFSSSKSNSFSLSRPSTITNSSSRAIVAGGSFSASKSSNFTASNSTSFTPRRFGSTSYTPTYYTSIYTPSAGRMLYMNGYDTSYVYFPHYYTYGVYQPIMNSNDDEGYQTAKFTWDGGYATYVKAYQAVDSIQRTEDGIVIVMKGKEIIIPNSDKQWWFLHTKSQTVQIAQGMVSINQNWGGVVALAILIFIVMITLGCLALYAGWKIYDEWKDNRPAEHRFQTW